MPLDGYLILQDKIFIKPWHIQQGRQDKYQVFFI